MASIAGAVTPYGDPIDWVAVAYHPATHAYLNHAAVVDGAYSIGGLMPGQVACVVCRPVSGDAWVANTEVAQGTYCVPTDPTTTPYLYEATTGGTTDATEPAWGMVLAGETTDNTVTWTHRGENIRGQVWMSVAEGGIPTRWLVAESDGELRRVLDGTGQGIDLPPGSAPGAPSSDYSIVVMTDQAGTWVMSEAGGGALASDDNGATWTALDWGSGAEVESLAAGCVSPGGVWVATQHQMQRYSRSTVGDGAWTYIDRGVNASSSYERLAGVVTAPGGNWLGALGSTPTGTMGCALSGTANDGEWMILDVGDAVVAPAAGDFPMLVWSGSKLVMLSRTGYQRVFNGMSFAAATATQIVTDGAYLATSIAATADYVVVGDTALGPYLYVADNTTLTYTQYDLTGVGAITASDRIGAVAVDANGVFCAVGTNGLMIEFSMPGVWTVVDAGFGATAHLKGVAALPVV